MLGALRSVGSSDSFGRFSLAALASHKPPSMLCVWQGEGERQSWQPEQVRRSPDEDEEDWVRPLLIVGEGKRCGDGLEVG